MISGIFSYELTVLRETYVINVNIQVKKSSPTKTHELF